MDKNATSLPPLFSLSRWRGSLIDFAIILPVFALLWAYLNPFLGVVYSPDSYEYFLLGNRFVRHGEFASIAVRDLYGALQFPQPNRSFPPLWPLIGGLTDLVTGAGINALAFANGIVLFLTLWLFLRFAKRLAPGAWMTVFLAFPVFFLLDFEYRIELASGRAIPLTYIFTLWMWLTMVASLQSKRLQPGYAIAIGLAATGMILTRVDQLIYAVAFTGMIFFAWYRVFPRKMVINTALLTLGTLFIAYLPWGLRNLIAFGHPVAMHGSSVALSIGGDGGYSFFAPKNIPHTLFQDFHVWLIQRLGNLTINLNIVREQTAALIPFTCLLVGLAWQKLKSHERWLFVAFGLQAASVLFTVSMVPAHDARYFSLIKLELLILAALSLSRLLIGHRRVMIGWLVAVCAILGWNLLPASRLALRNDPNPFIALSPQIPPATEAFRQLTPALQQVTGTQSVIATYAVRAEEFSYYTGMKSIYLPMNCITRDDNFNAWLTAWHPDFIFVQAFWVDHMELTGWVIPGTHFDDNYQLLRVPRQTTEIFHPIAPLTIKKISTLRVFKAGISPCPPRPFFKAHDPTALGPCPRMPRGA